jgi:hypothetical protein
MDGLKCKCGGRLDLTTGGCVDCKKQCLQGIDSIMIGSTKVTFNVVPEPEQEYYPEEEAPREIEDWDAYNQLFGIR